MYFWQVSDEPIRGFILSNVALISCCIQQLLSLNQVQFLRFGWAVGALLLKNEQYCLSSLLLVITISIISNVIPKTRTKHFSQLLWVAIFTQLTNSALWWWVDWYNADRKSYFLDNPSFTFIWNIWLFCVLHDPPKENYKV